jgi:DNA polymerase-3 subunit delta
MKVYANQLVETLKQKSLRIFVVSGDEPLLVQESCDLVRRGLKAQGFIERDLFYAESGFDWSGLLYSSNSMSLFAEKKLIEVRLPTGKPGDAGGKVLTELVSSLSEDNALLLVLPRADPSTQRTKWFKSVEAVAGFVQVWPIEAKELPRWLENRFRQAGLKVTRDALRVMAQRTEGNLLASVQEIERLKLIVGEREVNVDDVSAGVADSARYDVFKLIDAGLAGDLKRCVRMTTGLKAGGVEPLFIVNMLVREIRSIESIKTAINQNQNQNQNQNRGAGQREAFKKARVWDKRVPLVTKCLDRHDSRSLQEMLLQLGSVDRTVKGLESGDPWRKLQDVVFRLAGLEQFSRVGAL